MVAIMNIGSKHRVKRKERNGQIDWETGMNSLRSLLCETVLKLCPKIGERLRQKEKTKRHKDLRYKKCHILKNTGMLKRENFTAHEGTNIVRCQWWARTRGFKKHLQSSKETFTKSHQQEYMGFSPRLEHAKRLIPLFLCAYCTPTSIFH